MKILYYRIRFFTLVAVVSLLAVTAFAQTTEFTYQGRLNNSSGTPLTGNYDFEFKLFDALTGGAQTGATQQKSGVAVSNGIFTVNLDFGSQFGGAARFLEISVKQGANPFAPLSPRQPIASAPYSIRSLTAANAANADRLGNVSASNYVQTNSTSFVRNQTGQQIADFNINGTGTANVFNAASQFNIGGSRVLSVAGSVNVFAGVNAGGANPAANSGNAAFGAGAGSANAGDSNTFIGSFAGAGNTTGGSNTLIGSFADVGAANLDHATAIGADAVVSTSNSVVLGRNLDTVRIPGNLNVAGTLNANGSSLTNLNASNIASGTISNSRLGVIGAANGGTGLNSLGASGSFLRSNGSSWESSGILPADVPSSSGFYIQNRLTQQSNSNFNISGGGTLGGTLSANAVNSATQYNLNGVRVFSSPGTSNTLVGDAAGGVSPAGSSNTFVGRFSGQSNTGSSNTFVGVSTGTNNSSGANNSFFGAGAGGNNATGGNNTAIGANAVFLSNGFTYSTAIGAGATATGSNSIALGRFTGEDRVNVFGELTVSRIGFGGDEPLCRNANSLISSCSSSLRYKTNVASFNSGLNLVKRLQPIAFDWKASGKHDLGLGAEDVAKVEPRLVTYNEKGEVEGVKYDRVGIVLLNAVKEQQFEIERQRETIESLQNQVDEIKKLVCELKPQAAVCRKEK